MGPSRLIATLVGSDILLEVEYSVEPINQVNPLFQLSSRLSCWRSSLRAPGDGFGPEVSFPVIMERGLWGECHSGAGASAENDWKVVWLPSNWRRS
jgi:hypothetical protein